jgi:hypothetical protein
MAHSTKTFACIFEASNSSIMKIPTKRFLEKATKQAKSLPLVLQGGLKNCNNLYFLPPFFAQLSFTLDDSGA